MSFFHWSRFYRPLRHQQYSLDIHHFASTLVLTPTLGEYANHPLSRRSLSQLTPALKQKSLVKPLPSREPTAFFGLTPHKSTKNEKDPKEHESLAEELTEKSKNNKLNAARRLLKESNHRTLDMYNTLLKGYAKQFMHFRNQKEVTSLVNEMCRNGIQPSSQTYMQILLGYFSLRNNNSNDIKRAKAWFKRFMTHEATVNYFDSHAIIRKFIQIMSTTGHRAMYFVVTTALEANIPFDEAMLYQAIKGCMAARHEPKAELILDFIRRRQYACTHPPTTRMYHALIRGYLDPHARFMLDRATKVFQLMLQDGIVADAEVYRTFVVAYTSVPLQDEETQKARLEMLQRLWQAMLAVSEEGRRVDEWIVQALCRYYIAQDALPEAEQLYWDMRKHGHKLTRFLVPDFCSLMIAFATRYQLPSAISLYYDMLTLGHRPGSKVKGSIICKTADKNNLELSKQLLDITKEVSDIQTDTMRTEDHCCAVLIRECVRMGDIQSAKNVFDTLEDAPESISIELARDAMIRAYMREKRLDKAEEIIAQKRVFLTDSLNAIVEGYASLARWDAVSRYMRHPPTPPTPRTHSIIVQSKILHGCVDEAHIYLSHVLKTHPLESMVASVQAVVAAYALKGQIKECHYWYSLMKKADIPQQQRDQAANVITRHCIPLNYENFLL
ncbi:hypothetical protein BDF14DRAFT_414399 [Spinellus fusiger]|nr:hypothetical protein BDF14DRAFT_414399 [Spinellus fusiger]